MSEGEGEKNEKPKFTLPTPEQIAQEDMFNNCFVRSVMAGVMGGMLGVVFGLFSLGLDSTTSSMAAVETPPEKVRFRDALRDTIRTTGSKSWTFAKGFGAMGFMFSGSECVVEKWRAKHDLYNSAYAGCFTGAVLAHSGGPKMMCLGCGSFAAFSVFLDRFLER